MPEILYLSALQIVSVKRHAYRLSQNLKFHLEIFQTSRRGWGVRSKDYIAQGDFVCEYVGELRNCNAALPNPYTLEIDCEQRIKGHRGKIISNPRTIQGIWTLDKRPAEESSESPEFCIDSLFRGNVSRFVNHSCEPNLFSPSVMYNHSANEKAIKASRVVLFAKRDIPVNEELTFDYGQRRRKEFVCYCDFCQGHRG